jgi:hypothetical protein
MTDLENLLSDALRSSATATYAEPRAADDAVFEIDVVPLHPSSGLGLRVLALVGGAAATALAIAFAVVIASVAGGSPRPAHDSVAPAGATPAASGPYGLAAGQFRKVSVRSKGSVIETVWIPADPHQTWRLWEPAMGPDSKPGFQTASCGAFEYFQPPTSYSPACNPQQWDVSAAAIRAALAAPGSPQPAIDAFHNGVGLLSSGWAPDATARRIEAALVGISGVTVTHGVADGAGGSGDLISISYRIKATQNMMTTGIVVDPASGRVLAYYEKLPTQTFTTDPRTGKHLDTPEVIPGGVSLQSLQYSVVGSITG